MAKFVAMAEEAEFTPSSAPVTKAIIVANVVVYVVEVALVAVLLSVQKEEGISLLDAAFRIPHRVSLLFGANHAAATLGEARIETLVTACFLHSGVMHIGLNMFMLHRAGELLEGIVGSARMAYLYLASGVAGSAASALVHTVEGSASYSVGASGAIMGVMAAATVVAQRLRGIGHPATRSMAGWLALNLALGFAMNMQGARTDNAAHVGGAVTGALVAAMWDRSFRYSPRATRGVLVAVALCIVASAGVVVVRNVLDPLAPLLAEERLQIAQLAAKRGDCRDARLALAGAERLLVRTDTRISNARRAIFLRCLGDDGGPTSD